MKDDTATAQLAATDAVDATRRPDAAGALTQDYDRLLMLRLCTWVFGFLTITGTVATIFSALAGEETYAVNVATVVVAAVTFAALLGWGRRLPGWGVIATPLWADVLIGLNVLFGAGVARVLWILPVACLAYVGRSRAAQVVVAVNAVVLAVTFVVNDNFDSEFLVASWLVLVATMAGTVYLVRRLRSTRDAESRVLISLAQALDLRDTGTFSHSSTVGMLAEALARAAGLPLDRTRSVGLAGVLHDIGKVSVTDAVLRKPGALDDEEWHEMRAHAQQGADIVAAAGLDEIAGWIAMHHERLDGSGYPRGLAGDEIPVEARILAIADAYEAMTSDRPYRRARSAREAFAELRRDARGRLDPVLVGLFHDVVSERLGLDVTPSRPPSSPQR